MCKFLLQVTLCPCNNRDCSQLNSEPNDRDVDVVPQWGHIATIHSCFRQGPKCPKFFMKDDPNRVLHVYGMRANNPNSRQDCPDKTFVFQKNYRELPGICRECIEQCAQFEDDESSWDSSDGGVYLEFIEDEGQKDGQAKPEEKSRGTIEDKNQGLGSRDNSRQPGDGNQRQLPRMPPFDQEEYTKNFHFGRLPITRPDTDAEPCLRPVYKSEML